MNLAGIMMVRNEAPIIADCVGHLLHHVGVDQLLVADNGSTDDTLRILRRIAARDRRVRLHDATGDFHQPDVIYGLAEQARIDGADWLLPNDADEFLWLDGATLRSRCVAAGDVGGFKLRVTNFIQLGGVARDRLGSIETMAFRALPYGSMEEAKLLVEQRSLPFVRINYPPKVLVRAAPGLRFSRGQHSAEGIVAPLADECLAELLHAPIRSRDDLANRVEHGRRLLNVAPDPDTGWHLKRLISLGEDRLDEEWRANSMGWRSVCRGGFRLDLRLARLGLRQRGFRREMTAA